MSAYSATTAPGVEALQPAPGEGRPTAWWGVVTLIMTEATLFAGLIASYFFLRAVTKQWPPAGIEAPKLPLAIIFSLVLWGSSIPMLVAERGIKRGNQTALRGGLLMAWLMGAAFLLYTFYDFHELHFGWGTNAYGSVYYVTIGLHATHVFIGLLMSIVIQIKAWQNKFSERRHNSVQVYALYWHFVDAVWVFVFSAFVLSPHIR